MRRKQGALIPIEQSILIAAMLLRARGDEEFHGFRIAREIKARADARLLTAHGTLYRALGRLEKQGYLNSRWEDPALAAEESRPRRKLYKITDAGTIAGAPAASKAPVPNDDSKAMKPALET